MDGDRLLKNEPLQNRWPSSGSRRELACLSGGSSDLAMPLLIVPGISSSRQTSGAWRCHVRVISAGPGKASGPECWLEGVLAITMPRLLRHLHVHPKPSRSHGLHSQCLPLLWTWAHLPLAAASPSQSIISISQPICAALILNAPGTLSDALAHTDLPLHVYSV